MATIDTHQEMIKKAVMQRPDAVVAVTMRLWERLADDLILIIGDGGFQSLYSRSVYLTSIKFPWLAISDLSQLTKPRFANFKVSLEGQDIKTAGEASIALLTTFIDLLSYLIGELLATSVLRAGWSDGALGAAAREHP